NDDADTPEPFKASALFLYRAALDFRETHEPSDTPAGQTMAAQTADAQTMDKGVSIGNIMSALIRLGVPAEQAWPYPPHTQDETAHREQLARDPHPSCYLSAREFQISKYFRLDQDPTRDRHLLLAQIKAVLASGLPCMFGFGAVQALEQTLADGNIPYLTPQTGEAKGINTPVAVMGHALVAMGYDDAKVIGDRSGALLVRNSWVSNDGGTRQPWGDGGYGWLPYEYVLEPEPASRVADCWTLVDWKSVQRKAIAGKFGIRLGDQTPRPGRP
ncbi:MAG: C1 family peptidase, partial [Pseudomonadota bacterium]